MSNEIEDLRGIIEMQAKLLAEMAAKPAEQRCAELEMELAIMRMVMRRLLDAPAHEPFPACDCEWEQAWREANKLLGE